MATGGVTVTGLREMRAGARALPAALSGALRGVAASTAVRIRTGARARLAAQTAGTGRTGDSLAIVEDAAGKAFRVEPTPVPRRPANLPLWLEYGTWKMGARPFLGPALQAESAQYIRACTAIVDRYGRSALG